jgi:hypothetical protein
VEWARFVLSGNGVIATQVANSEQITRIGAKVRETLGKQSEETPSATANSASRKAVGKSS